MTDENEYEKKWGKFKNKVHSDAISKQKLKKIIQSLDNERQWAALHYAVDCNNVKFCETMLQDEQYKCGKLLFTKFKSIT